MSRSIRRSPRRGGASWASARTRGSTWLRPTGGPSSSTTNERYDLIVIDAYRQPYIPFYLATREFFRLARERLVPGGVLALNVAQVAGRRPARRGDRKHAPGRVPAGAGAGSRSASTSSCWASTGRSRREELLDRASERRLAHRLAGAAARDGSCRPVRAEVSPLTDDQAPVEWLTDRMIVDYVAEGGGNIEEDLLPTAP